jgi:hypothetical protein
MLSTPASPSSAQPVRLFTISSSKTTFGSSNLLHTLHPNGNVIAGTPRLARPYHRHAPLARRQLPDLHRSRQTPRPARLPMRCHRPSRLWQLLPAAGLLHPRHGASSHRYHPRTSQPKLSRPRRPLAPRRPLHGWQTLYAPRPRRRRQHSRPRKPPRPRPPLALHALPRTHVRAPAPGQHP